MIQFRLKQFSEFIEKLFSSIDNKNLVSYSETSCRDIIKCMEMWQEDSVMHWINDVALSHLNKLKRSKINYSTLFVSCENVTQLSNLKIELSLQEFIKENNPEESVKRLKEIILQEKDSGSLKYKSHLKTLKDFKFSDKFYVSFFTILGYLVNGQVTINDILDKGVYVENPSGKIRGKFIPKSAINLLDKDEVLINIIIFISFYQKENCKNKQVTEIIDNFYLDDEE